MSIASNFHSTIKHAQIQYSWNEYLNIADTNNKLHDLLPDIFHIIPSGTYYRVNITNKRLNYLQNNTSFTLTFLILHVYCFPTGVSTEWPTPSVCLTSSSYSPCHVELVIMPANSLLFCVQPIISEFDIPPCHEVKLPNIVSLGLPLPLFPIQFSSGQAYSRPPLLIT
ncbi:hypothetical protein BsWGS_11344 [Bradybaena similaris]